MATPKMTNSTTIPGNGFNCKNFHMLKYVTLSDHWNDIHYRNKAKWHN